MSSRKMSALGDDQCLLAHRLDLIPTNVHRIDWCKMIGFDGKV